MSGQNAWRLFSRVCFLLAALTALGGVAVGAGIGGETTVAAAAATTPVPAYDARVLGEVDRRVDVAALSADNVLLLNTWATWCGPCRDEIPDFEAIHQRYGKDGLRVVGVNIDEGGGDENVRSFAEGIGITYDVWRDPNNRFAKAFRVLGPPETFLVADGAILRHWRGQMDPSAPENLPSIQAALGISGPGVSATGAVATAGLLAAFGAGLLSVLSPCVLPLIPTYAAVLTAVRLRKTRNRRSVPVAVGAAQPAGPDSGPGPDSDSDRALPWARTARSRSAPVWPSSPGSARCSSPSASRSTAPATRWRTTGSG